MIDTSERDFEASIEQVLVSPEKVSGVREEGSPYGFYNPGGYRKRDTKDYDRGLCLIPQDVIDFLYATQPAEWKRLQGHHSSEVKERFLKRLASEAWNRGTLEVLRKGIKDSGCSFKLAYFRPHSGLNEELQRKYEANVFTVVRQLHYSEKSENSLDLALFLNGLPIFTAELKNPFKGQTVENAIRQYRFDRDPREPLFAFRRCLAHFAVDPDWAYMATHVQGATTEFLPFNQGKYGGAGNPPRMNGFSTSYLWERVWSKDSVLNLIQQFIHPVEEEDDRGRKTGRKFLIFPRYHQLDAVRRLVAHARTNGTGHTYLVQHSAGSGKSNSIAWLAHQLSVLHDAQDQRVFDSIVVITDRRVLDRQLQRTVRQFEQTWGVVENIDTTSRQLKEALEAGKTIIVTTLQKFPVIANEIGELPGKRFAVIVDEAHSSQSGGKSGKSLKQVLSVGSLEEAEREESGEEEDLEDRIVAEMRMRGRQPNLSTFAFTATPKPKTLELFGTPREDGMYEAFSLYSMRQAIEEGFILDVLENYTTYRTYWRLLKTIEEDPSYDRKKASYLLRSFVDLHEHAVRKKVEIMVEHFADRVAHRIGGKAKAMIVTRSRLHAVRYKQVVDEYLREKKYPYRALVAFSGTVNDGGIQYTESNMNGFPESQTAETFKRDENKFLIVAEKFQTGYDMPLLHTMYVDKKLGGVHAVQTLSRLNRVYPGKKETMVLDFTNEAEEIQKGFQPYYEKTLLSEATDPNLLYDRQRDLEEAGFYTKVEVDEFAKVFFSAKGTQDRLHAILEPVVERFRGAPEDEQEAFRSNLSDYVRLYSFLSQILTFADPDLEKLYEFARLLRRKLPPRPNELPREVTESIDMEAYRLQKTRNGKISLTRGEGEVDPIGLQGPIVPAPGEIEALSQILDELNRRFGTDFAEDDKVFIRQLEEKIAGDETLEVSVRTNPPENARLTFDHVVNDHLQDMVETNFKFYKRVTDDRDFGKFFLNWLFERFYEKVLKAP